MNQTLLISFILRLLVTPTYSHKQTAKTTAPIILSEIKNSNSDIDPKLLATMIYVESSYNPKAESYKGATGLLGIMPDNPRALKYTKEQLQSPRTNIRVGLRIIRDARKSCRQSVEAQLGYSDPRMWLGKYAGFGCRENAYATKVLNLLQVIENS